MSDPKPLKHPHSHYWKTTKKGRIMEGWVQSKDSEGKTVREVELVDPKTGERERKKVKRYEKMPGLIKVASGGARIERPKPRDKGLDALEDDDEGTGLGRRKKKGKKKCSIM